VDAEVYSLHVKRIGIEELVRYVYIVRVDTVRWDAHFLPTRVELYFQACSITVLSGKRVATARVEVMLLAGCPPPVSHRGLSSFTNALVAKVNLTVVSISVRFERYSYLN
jgi:hypothetical protein